MWYFQNTFEIREQSFISASSICMTASLTKRLVVFWKNDVKQNTKKKKSYNPALHFNIGKKLYDTPHSPPHISVITGNILITM